MRVWNVAGGGRLQGRIRVPGDKSISHRSVMLGSLAEGVTEVQGLLEGEDVLSTIAAFRSMGVTMEGPRDGALRIRGVGLQGLRPAPGALDMGNSGTAMRLLAGILAGQSFGSVLTGDASLQRRPMRRVADPLTQMGARIETAAGGVPPMVIAGAPLRGLRYRLPVASAQVKSAILLAGLYATGTTTVEEPGPSRDHTERMLRGFGYAVDVAGPEITLTGGGRLRGRALEIPADLSSAAFFLVGAAAFPGSELMLPHVGLNPTRTGILDILEKMGADITIENRREIGGEPVADLKVRGRRLHGIAVPAQLVPLAIDEFPILFVAAALAEGTTTICGAEELRVKETDRIAAAAAGLRALGVAVTEQADGVTIQGGILTPGTVDSHGDHRIAMAFAIAALAVSGTVIIKDCKNVDTSFPGFVDKARAVGLSIQVTGE